MTLYCNSLADRIKCFSGADKFAGGVDKLGKLKDQLANDIKVAMKAKEKLRTSVLRMLLSEMKYAQVSGSSHEELDEASELKVLQTYHKRLDKSLIDFKGTANEQSVRDELKIVEEYLPKKASEQEVKEAIKAVMSSTEDRQFGTLMKQVLSKLGTSADGKIVSKLLKESLGS